MKRLTYLKQASIFVLVLSIGLTLNAKAATTADATPAQTMTESKIVFNAASQIGVRESGTNYVAGKPYGQIGAAWCGDFVRWVLQASGIDITANGRGALGSSYAVARAWAYYGANGGGYGRWGWMRDAMPGDLLIDNYNGTPSTGGHISIVIDSNINGQSNLVRTVGGNESDSVRDQIKDLNTNGRYLVTLRELRAQSVPMFGGGAAVFDRFQSGYGGIVKVTSIWAPGKIYVGAELANSAYRIRTRNAFTGEINYWRADTAIASELYRNVTLVVVIGTNRYMDIATLTHN